MMIVALGNMAVFLLKYIPQPEEVASIESLLYLHWDSVMRGEVWRLITFVFVPPESMFWLLTPLIIYFYYWMGRTLEADWGRLRFTIFYLSGIFLTILYAAVTGRIAEGSDLNMSLFLVFAALFPEMTIRMFFLFPIKIKWLALLDIGFILFSVIAQRSLAPLIPLLNFILYFAPSIIRNLLRRQKYQKNTIEFKSTIRRTAKAKGYIHKCTICGLTDADAPQLEFRYCSLCAGYECYCEAHIRNHEHKGG